VLERQVDGASHGAGDTQVVQFFELSLPAGHEPSIGRRADVALNSG
jgi:hypothetical protein